MSQQIISTFADKHNPASKYADLKVGMTVRVHQRLKAGEKGKNQIFEGIIIARKHGDEAGATMTVRRSIGGYGVEKVYPLRLPSIDKIEVVKAGRTRRAKMYYLRDKTAKEIRRKTRSEASVVSVAAEEAPAAEEATS